MLQKLRTHVTNKLIFPDHPTSGDEQVLDELRKQDPQQWQQATTADYLQSVKTGDNPLLSTLLGQVEFDINYPNRWTSFELYIELVKYYVLSFSIEALNEVSSFGYPLRSKFTPFSLCIEFLLRLYRLNIKNLFLNSNVYVAMQRRWQSEIIDPLITKGADIELGRYRFKQTLLSACLEHFIPPEVDGGIIALTQYVLDRTKLINEADITGKTALATAVLRELPIPFLEKIMARQAAPNPCFAADFFKTSREHLLCHLIRKQAYAHIEWLLQQGANPNLVPVDANPSTQTIQQETWLSPYQLAVALDDARAIDLINQAAIKRKIELIPNLSRIESNRDQKIYASPVLKFQGTKLFLQCKSRLFSSSSHLLADIFQKFGVKCFVNNDSDKPNTIKALTWLFRNASQSCARKFWQLAHHFILQECSNNPKFALYVSNAPAGAKPNDHCSGLYCDNIYISNGLSEALMVDVLIHEIGHLVDCNSLKLTSFQAINDPLAQLFREYVTKDLAQMSNIDAWISFRLFTLKSAYAKESFEEYFTLIFFELPIHFAYENPRATEAQLFNHMSQHFPNCMSWFDSYIARFVLKNISCHF